MAAGTVKERDFVLCSNEIKEGLHIERETQSVDIVEIAFRPDEPVEVFTLSSQDSILIKGRGNPPKVRRGGMCKKGKPSRDPFEQAGFPDAHTSWL